MGKLLELETGKKYPQNQIYLKIFYVGGPSEVQCRDPIEGRMVVR